MSYQASGVNRDLGDTFVSQISKWVKSTQNSKVVAGVGGFASLYQLNSTDLLAAATDGVGTKLKLAFELNEHKTIGEDLVAMCVNDLLCVGAQPLFFLDYLATGKLNPRQASDVVYGITQGCLKAQCALVGGETAEMPGFYAKGEYDCAGFAVGLVKKKAVLPRKTIKNNDVLISLPSSGFHSNGYSLLRALVQKKATQSNRKKLLKALLTPTEIYTQALGKILNQVSVKAAAHITGSGLLNLPRVGSKFHYEVQLPSFETLPWAMREIFHWDLVTGKELCQTFNMGMGMIIVVDPKKKDRVLKDLKRFYPNARVCGRVSSKVTPSEGSSKIKVHSDRWGSFELQ